MSGVVADLLQNLITYVNLLLDNEFIQYFLGLFIILICIGLFRQVLRINKI